VVVQRADGVGVGLLETRDDLVEPRAQPGRGFRASIAQRLASWGGQAA